MPKRQYRQVSLDNARNAHRHTDEWWEACSRVDEAKLRLETARGEFLKRRAYRLCYFGRPLEAWEREVLKVLVAREQKRRYLREGRLKWIRHS